MKRKKGKERNKEKEIIEKKRKKRDEKKREWKETGIVVDSSWPHLWLKTGCPHLLYQLNCKVLCQTHIYPYAFIGSPSYIHPRDERLEAGVDLGIIERD